TLEDITPTVQPAVAINYGATVSGTIDDTSPRVLYTFEGSAGETINIRMSAKSGDLDPYLKLLDGSGAILIENDDENSDRGRGSYIGGFELPSDGTYTIMATRFQEELGTLSGDFSLTLTNGVEAPPTETGGSSEGTNLRYGDSVSGTITDTTSSVNYTFEGKSGDTVTIRMRVDNGSLDPYLQLLDASGSVLIENDDDPNGNRDSAIEVFELPADGTYTIVATRFQGELGGTVGDFTLSLESENGSASNQSAATATPGAQANVLPGDIHIEGLLTMDGSVSGELTPDKPVLFYRYEATAGEIVTFSADSPDKKLDPLLILVAPDGKEIARDDDASRFNRGSIVDSIRFPEAGQYLLVVTRSPRRGANTNGDFQLLAFAGQDNPPAIAVLPVVADYNQPVDLNLTQQRDEAVLVFQGKAGDQVHVIISRTRGNVATAYMLANPAAGIVAGHGNEEDFVVSLPVDGYYSLLLLGRRGVGTVTVTLNQG
ncbi:MAG TPA: PPC domain-containing protein, partial [Phototrophicaceae bacterium]|nr:PPC domain-containing protein [Phototrophicaceae bacterium]